MLTVHGITLYNRRTIVAAPTKKRAAELLGITARHLREFGCPTGNQTELDVALAEPETCFAETRPYSGRYERWSPS